MKLVSCLLIKLFTIGSSISLFKLSKEEIKKYENRYDEVPNIFSTMLPLKGAINAYEVLSEVYDTYILSTAP